MNTTQGIYDLLERRRIELGLSQAEASFRIVGRKDSSFFQGLRRGSMPSAAKLEAACTALGLEFYVGPPRNLYLAEKIAPDIDTPPSATLAQTVAESLAPYAPGPSFHRVLSLEFHAQALLGIMLEGHPLSVIKVLGNYMAPTLCDGDWAVVDYSQRELEPGGVFVLNGDPIPCIRRIRKAADGWWGDCDNKKPGYDPVALGEQDKITGRVVWWMHAEAR